MKILICNTVDWYGGASRGAYRLLESLILHGIDAKMLVLHKKTNSNHVISVQELENPNCIKKTIKRLIYKLKNKLRKYKWAQYKNKLNVYCSDVVISSLGKSLEKIDFDILHLHWVEDDFINFYDIRNIQKPIVWTTHGVYPFTGICHILICNRFQQQCGTCPILRSDKENDLSRKNFLLKQKRYRSLNLNIIGPSQWIAARAKESSLFGNRPIYVIPNVLNINLYSPIDKNIAQNMLNLDKSKKIILFGAISATSDDNKGFQILISALNLLEIKYKRNQLLLVIFGSDQALDFETYFETISLGHIHDESKMVLAYSAADIMVVPSKYENLPYTIMESLACATPVVAFNIGGINDMIEHKLNGFLAQPHDPNSLAEGIYWCLENNDSNVLGKSGRNKIENEFDGEKTLQKHIELYQSLI